MGKIGVGIGDDFPIDDSKQEGASSGPSPDYNDPEYQKRREEWRRARETWREQRRQWREQWKQHRRAWREEMRARYGDDYYAHYHGPDWGPHHLFRILLTLGLIVMAITIFSHLYIVFGLIVLVGLYLAYRGGFEHFDYTPASGPMPPRSSPPTAPPVDAPKA